MNEHQHCKTVMKIGQANCKACVNIAGLASTRSTVGMTQVMVIDDDCKPRRLIKGYLEPLGYEVPAAI